MTPPKPAIEPIHLGDFTATHRMVFMTAIAVAIGVIATYVAFALLKLIALFTDEVISVKSLELQNFALSEKELQIGRDLINHLTVPFQPQKFVNEHQQRLQNLIEKKARGEKIAILRPRPMKRTAPGKLLQALEASLKKVA